MFKDCRTYMDEVIQLKKTVTLSEPQTLGFKEVEDYLVKLNHAGLDDDRSDEEITEITKSNKLSGQEEQQILMAREEDFLKRNGIVINNNQTNELSRSSKTKIEDKIS